MNITLNKHALKKAMTVCKGFLPAKPLVEVDNHVLFSLEKDTLTVSATDNQQVCNYRLEYEKAEGEGEFSCDPKRMEKALTKSNCETVSLSFDQEKMSVQLDIGEDGKESIISLHSLETTRMSKFQPSLDSNGDNTHTVNKDIFGEALKYIQAFTPEKNQHSRKYDFAIIDNGIMYAANGVNKRGYFICREFKDFSKMNIQKKFLKNLSRVIPLLECITLCVTERTSVITVASDDGDCVIHMLKSRNLPPDVTRQYVNIKNDPFTIVKKEEVIKSLDRSSIANYSKVGTPIGIQLTLTGSGEEAKLKTDLVTSTLKNIDTIPCIRDEEGESSEVSHIIDYKLFKSILSSFTKNEETRFYINDPELKFFKIYTKSSIDEIPFAEIGVGAFSRKAR